MQLRYKRQPWSGIYFAKTATHTFAVDKVGSMWVLRAWDSNSNSKIVHYSDGNRTMAIAKAAAQAFAAQH